MRILMVTPLYWPDVSGATRLLRGYAEGLTARGHVVEVWTTDAAENRYLYFPSARRVPGKRELHGGVSVSRFPLWHPKNKEQTFSRAQRLPIPGSGDVFDAPHVVSPRLQLAARFRRSKVDMVIAGYLPFTSFIHAGQVIARTAGSPCVILPLLHIGEPGDETVLASFGRPRQRNLIRRADLLLANTEVEARALRRWGIHKERIAVIGAGLDLPLVQGGSAARFRRQYGLEYPIVFQISTQTHDKGSHHLVEAMKLVWGKGIKAHLVMVGKVLPDFDAYLSHQPKEILEHVYCLGHIDEELKKDLLAAGDILAMLSRAESFGIAFLETWVYGKPVVGCYAGSLPALIRDGVDGLLVPFADVHMLSETIAGLLKEKELRRAMGEAGRKKVLSTYLWAQRLTLLERTLLSLRNGSC